MYASWCVSLLPPLDDMSIVRIHARPSPWNVVFQTRTKTKAKTKKQKTTQTYQIKKNPTKNNQLNKQPRKLKQ